MTLSRDPLADRDLEGLRGAMARGETTARAIADAYLDRIARLDPTLAAFEHVDADSARAKADEIDERRAAGDRLGALAGLPVAVKDLFVVDGMPTTGGSNLDLAWLLDAHEGPFVRALRRADAVILGKTRTVEFAFGASGIGLSRGTPWNPADGEVRRVPGGSSSGSAVAVAAGLAAFAIGSDTGGSVRIPAALCETFGLKTSPGLWSTEGVLRLSPTFDTVGLLTRSAADAALAFGALSNELGAETPALAAPAAEAFPEPSLAGTRLARLVGWNAPLDPAVASAFDVAVARLAAMGVETVTIEAPEAAERAAIFPIVLAVELMSRFGPDHFAALRERMDPVVAMRLARALETDEATYRNAVDRHRELTLIMAARLSGVAAWIAPTTAIVAPPAASFEDPTLGLDLTLGITCNTQPVNLFGQCAVTIPLPGAHLPIGIQLATLGGRDRELLGLACAIERLLGRAMPADVAFAERRIHA